MTVIFSVRFCLAIFFWVLLARWSPSIAITLADAEQEMLRANPDIALAHAGIESAAANVTVAGQLPNPTLSAQTTQFSPVGGLGAGRPTDKSLDTIVGVSMPIERGDKSTLRREAALEQLAGARLDLYEMRRQQRLTLHQAYFDLKLAEEKLALARETRDLAAQALAAAGRRVAAGDLAAVDRYRLQVDALRTANDATAAEADVTQARIAIATVMGRSRGAPDNARGTAFEAAAASAAVERAAALGGDVSASDAWPAIAATAAGDGALAAIAQRADVAAAEARVAAANAARAVAHSLRTRDVTLGAQVERVPASSPGLTFGVSVSIPIFARYGFEGEIAKAEADYSTALLTRMKVMAQAEAEIRRTHSALDNARSRLSNFESDIVPAAKKALDAIEFAYARGAAPLTDVLDARRIWRATQADLAQARADHAKALSGWRAATEWETAR